MSLTPKQAAFVTEYLVDLNETQAAIRVGYSRKTAAQQGSRLFRNVQVRAAIAEAQSKRAQKLELRADDVLRELMRIGFADLSQAVDAKNRLLDIHAMPLEVRRSIASIETEQVGNGDGPPITVTKVKFWDKPGSLTALGKHLRLFVDRVEVDAKLSLADLVLEAAKKAKK